VAKGQARVPSRDPRGFPLHGERMAALLEAAPEVLRSRGFTPEPKPYRPRGWRSSVHVGFDDDGRAAVALPAPSLDLQELERRIGYLTGWTLGRGKGGASRPDVLCVLIPASEPVRVEMSRVGRKPRIEVVRISGVPPVRRMTDLKPFRQELRIFVHWEPSGAASKMEANGA
jgi:hypothetical protein